MQKLRSCSTPNYDCKEMKNFLNLNKNVVFVEIDKSKSLGIVDLNDYCHKLISVFSSDNMKFDSFPLIKRTMLRCFSDSSKEAPAI